MHPIFVEIDLTSSRRSDQALTFPEQVVSVSVHLLTILWDDESAVNYAGVFEFEYRARFVDTCVKDLLYDTMAY